MIKAVTTNDPSRLREIGFFHLILLCNKPLTELTSLSTAVKKKTKNTSLPPHQHIQKCQLTALSFIWIFLIIMQLLLLHIQNGVLNPIKWAMCCKGVGKHDWRQSLGWQTRAIWGRWKTACCEVNGRLCDDHWWSNGWRCVCVYVCTCETEGDKETKGEVWVYGMGKRYGILAVRI